MLCGGEYDCLLALFDDMLQYVEQHTGLLLLLHDEMLQSVRVVGQWVGKYVKNEPSMIAYVLIEMSVDGTIE